MVAASEVRHPIAPLADSLAGERLRYSNDEGADFRYTPGCITLTLRMPALRHQYPAADRARLHLPAGWHPVDDAGPRALGERGEVTWTVVPAGRPEVFRQILSCELLAEGRRLAVLEHIVPLELRGHSQFDPRCHTLPFRNAAGDLGAIEPEAELFRSTYRAAGAILPGAFFRGLYRDIVFLSAGPDERGGGGLCTGMARYALQRSLLEVRLPVPEGREAQVRAVQVWHGRQLTDRALLAAARQFFAPSAAASYLTFRRQVLDRGRAAVAFDVGIARWGWALRKLPAIVRRLITTGHTVTPYAFQQIDDDFAEVTVYDPSYPDEADQPENVARFDLARERYAYRGFGSLDRDDPSTVLAVAQMHFAAPGTAYLASLASLVLHPGTLVGEARQNAVMRRTLLAIAGVLLIVLGMKRAASEGHIP